jgi:hypothetical protein
VIDVLDIGCDPVMVNVTKQDFLDWLGWAVESEAIRFPLEAGSIRRPALNLEDIFNDVV